MRFIRLNWGKVMVLVLVCELLLFYWSALQHSLTLQQLKAEDKLRQPPISAVKKTEPGTPGGGGRRG